MIDLAGYLRPDRMLRIGPADRGALLRRLLAHASPAGPAADPEQFSSVDLGHGFMLCHTRTSAGGDFRVVVGMLEEPFRWGRGEPVHTVFCVLVPIDRSRDYLTLLARLSRFLSDAETEAAFRARDACRVAELAAAFRTGGAEAP